jgi:hypothetical protein
MRQSYNKVKGKTMPVIGRGGPQVCEAWRITDGGEIVSLTRQPAALYPPGRFLVLISVRG